MRKLPVYLLLDTSGSMHGEPIEAVRNGLQVMLSGFRGQPMALETVHLSIITFDSDARQVMPLTELADVRLPEIKASGCTALGGALSLVAQRADAEVQKAAVGVQADWKPLVFILSDGEPTDDLQKGIDNFNSRKWGMVVACAAGNGANTNTLKRITENVVRLDSTSSTDIASYLKWISQTISQTSKKIDEGHGSPTVMSDLPPLPPEIIEI